MVNQFGLTPRSTGAGIGAGIQQFTTSLSGTTFKTISTEKRGTFIIEVSGVASGAPQLKFVAEKKADTDVPSFKHIHATNAADTCALGYQWLPSSNIQIGKTLASFSGSYLITITG